jgi:pimeloyl-ACP methyl ester carboxylesterase
VRGLRPRPAARRRHRGGGGLERGEVLNVRLADGYALFVEPVGNDGLPLVISGGADSSENLKADVEASLDAMGDAGEPIAESWDWEKTVRSPEECAELMRVQTPFHFHGEAPPDFVADTVYAPEVLRHFANAGYGDFDYAPDFRRVSKPTLVIVGAHDRVTTPRAARVLHDGIPGSEYVELEGAGHMSMVESQGPYLDAVRRFLRRIS